MWISPWLNSTPLWPVPGNHTRGIPVLSCLAATCKASKNWLHQDTLRTILLRFSLIICMMYIPVNVHAHIIMQYPYVQMCMYILYTCYSEEFSFEQMPIICANWLGDAEISTPVLKYPFGPFGTVHCCSRAVLHNQAAMLKPNWNPLERYHFLHQKRVFCKLFMIFLKSITQTKAAKYMS